MTPEQVAEAVRLYRAGRTLREIAAELFGHETADHRISRAIRDQVQPRRSGPRGHSDVPDELIVALREHDKLSWSQIATKVSMSRNGARTRYLRAATRPNERRSQ